MVLKLVLFGVLFLISLIVASREIIVVAEKRRQEHASLSDFRRFRRRLKGLLLLNVLYGLGLFNGNIIRALDLTLHAQLLLFGLLIILLFWLLILMARELRAAAEDALVEKRKLREETFASIEEEIRRAREAKKSR